MTMEQLAPEVLKLPIRDRAALAASLWESIEDPYCQTGEMDDEAAFTLAEQRDAEIESGAVVALSHEELMTRLRS